MSNFVRKTKIALFPIFHLINSGEIHTLAEAATTSQFVVEVARDTWMEEKKMMKDREKERYFLFFKISTKIYRKF